MSKFVFRIILALVRLCYGKFEIQGLDTLPGRDVILVANHTQMHGPIVGELFLPEQYRIWCAGEMMHLKDVPAYAFSDFWSQKPRWTHPFYRAFSYLIAPLAVCIFNHARTIGVYHDARILSTFKETVSHLKDGGCVLIFPEKDEKQNNILYQFQEHFIDVARLYYKKTGRSVTFIPMYIAPKLRCAYCGSGVVFDADAPIEQERSRISAALTESITQIARDLPKHTVIPYRNIPKKNYLTNKDISEVPK